MKGKYLKQAMFFMAMLTNSLPLNTYGGNSSFANGTFIAEPELNSLQELTNIYEQHAATPSDINEHLPVLRNLSKECSSVVEIGVRGLVSSWGVVLGLAENPFEERFYMGIDLHMPPLDKFHLIKRLSEENGVNFQFQVGNDMQLDIPQTDMLFIDSLHTYCHLTYELNKFASKVNKYISLHDTSEPWGDRDDNEYYGDYSEYPDDIDRTKRGLWLAVEDFLSSHPDWALVERRLNNHGFTTLERVQKDTKELR